VGDPIKPRIKVDPQVVFQEVDGELLLLHIERGQYFSLDGVGARVWRLLREHDGNLEGVLSTLLTEFDIDETTLRRDVDALLGHLREAGLVAA
jgi:Coenzyme PQQ synthesis protein D (PqqD)